jgi:hypothetical protein
MYLNHPTTPMPTVIVRPHQSFSQTQHSISKHHANAPTYTMGPLGRPKPLQSLHYT